eukprot:s1717_g3.t1
MFHPSLCEAEVSVPQLYQHGISTDGMEKVAVKISLDDQSRRKGRKKVLVADLSWTSGSGRSALEEDGGQDHQGNVSDARELLNRYTHFVIDAFESALPKYTGLISRTPMNLLLFVLYIFSVMYFIMKVVLFSAWLAMSILFCLCCCGCRCCRKKAAKEPADAKAKNGKATKATAAEKGKAATAASNNKPAAKAKK